MKQKLLLVLGFMLVTLGLQAEDYSYTFTKNGTLFAKNETKELNGVEWTLDGDGGYWSWDNNSQKGEQLGSSSKPYKSMTLSTSGISGTITKIVLNTSGGSKINATATVTVGGETFGDKITLTTSPTDYEFEGSASGKIVISYTQTSSKAIYIQSIAVTYTPAENAGPAKPALTSSCKFLGEQVVEISCPTEGAEIYYTTDGTEPTAESTKYSESFTVAATTTVKAIAVNENGSSEVATATYTKAELMSIAEAKAAYDAASADTEVFIDLAGAVVTVNKGQYLFIQDETTGINIYGSNADYEPGTKFTAGVLSGTSTAYNKMHQIASAEFSNVETTTTTVEPIEVSVADLADAAKYATYEGRYVKLTGVTLEGKTITQGEDTYAAYDRFSLSFADEYAEATTCDIEGIPACYNTTLQIYPVEITEVSQETGIEAAVSENVAPVVYDLLGRRVDNPTSGIFIVNGKKVVIK